jgi:alkylation response protein AidB-like acyl-CoA dehydrogenase
MVYFNDCEVPAEQLLGEQDHGWTQLMAGLNTERLILAATMLGIGQRAFDDALAYAKERKQFGRPIGSFQALQHRFADLATDLEAAQRAALQSMQMMGGYGYSSEYDMERLVRSTLVSTIYGGTSEIQRGIIAKTLGL